MWPSWISWLVVGTVALAVVVAAVTIDWWYPIESDALPPKKPSHSVRT